MCRNVYTVASDCAITRAVVSGVSEQLETKSSTDGTCNTITHESISTTTSAWLHLIDVPTTILCQHLAIRQCHGRSVNVSMVIMYCHVQFILCLLLFSQVCVFAVCGSDGTVVLSLVFLSVKL